MSASAFWALAFGAVGLVLFIAVHSGRRLSRNALALALGATPTAAGVCGERNGVRWELRWVRGFGRLQLHLGGRVPKRLRLGGRWEQDVREDVTTGAQHFDDRTLLGGDQAYIVAVYDAETRRLVDGLVTSRRQAWVDEDDIVIERVAASAMREAPRLHAVDVELHHLRSAPHSRVAPGCRSLGASAEHPRSALGREPYA